MKRIYCCECQEFKNRKNMRLKYNPYLFKKKIYCPECKTFAIISLETEKEQCCATCEYWLGKYFKCEHPDQRQSEADDYIALPEKYCELWESNSK